MKDIYWVEDSSENPPICNKRKRRVGKRTIEFIGWGSSLLIEFLEAIGQDTRKKHSQHDVAILITKYINEKGLVSAEKKKKVLCDERLRALFGKKSMSRIKVHEMLEEHFAENQDSEDELLDSSEEEDYRERSSLGSKNNPTGQMKRVPKTPKSCFAAVIPENIKLIYLKKSLIQKLLDAPESFENKLVGSFVRMKSDPNDIYQRNRFQLQQVTGVEKICGGDDGSLEMRLRVSNFFKEIPICMLSDDNFSEEEIEDLRDRVKAGLLKRLNVNEVELKAQMLHADITKHWIAKEISLLRNLIDHANEKGWRREMFEYLERRKILQTPAEQEKILLKIPEVIAEELEPEGTVAAVSEKAEGSGCSPKSILRGSSDVSSTDASGFGDSLAPSQVISSDSHTPSVRNTGIDDIMPVKDPNGHRDAYETSKQVKEVGDRPADIVQQGAWIANLICDGSSREMQVVGSGEKVPQEKPEQLAITTTVIDLCDDESDDEAPAGIDRSTGECLDDVIWHYLDPKGETRGPFSLRSLKRWSDSNYFHSGFIVWKTSGDAVLLVDVLRRAFPL